MIFLNTFRRESIRNYIEIFFVSFSYFKKGNLIFAYYISGYNINDELFNKKLFVIYLNNNLIVYYDNSFVEIKEIRIIDNNIKLFIVLKCNKHSESFLWVRKYF